MGQAATQSAQHLACSLVTSTSHRLLARMRKAAYGSPSPFVCGRALGPSASQLPSA